MLDRRTALAKGEQRKAAGEARAATAIRDDNGKLLSSGAADVDRPAGPAEKKERVRSGEVRAVIAKQADVSEKRSGRCARSATKTPTPYQRIVKGMSTNGGAQNPTI